ncbi:MAG: DUF3226 domain-containing protein [Spirosomataceae bacterium]
MSIPKKERFSQKLLLEGKDDLFVTAAICEKSAVVETFDLIDCDGVDNISAHVELYCLKKRPSVETIGVILDADISLESRWQSLKKQLESLGYELPLQPDKNGTIIEGRDRNPTIGIWLMPDNNATGMLEDFVKFLVPEEDTLLVEADRILREIEQEHLHKYGLIHKSKARIHTWLAWQEDPGTPLGLAITKNYLTTQSEHCQQFVAWLNRLFAIEA